MTENDKARKAGVPKWLKRYNARYGSGGVDGIVACHRQNRDAESIAYGRSHKRRRLLEIQEDEADAEVRAD